MKVSSGISAGILNTEVVGTDVIEGVCVVNINTSIIFSHD